MDVKIDSRKLRELRCGRSWSQSQLAEVSGLSLRTVQRIETDGRCSLESRQGIAAVFDLQPPELDPPNLSNTRKNSLNLGIKAGQAGVMIGGFCAAIGVGQALWNGGISAETAGGYFAGLGILCGVLCGGLFVLARRGKLV